MQMHTLNCKTTNNYWKTCKLKCYLVNIPIKTRFFSSRPPFATVPVRCLHFIYIVCAEILVLMPDTSWALIAQRWEKSLIAAVLIHINCKTKCRRLGEYVYSNNWHNKLHPSQWAEAGESRREMADAHSDSFFSLPYQKRIAFKCNNIAYPAERVQKIAQCICACPLVIIKIIKWYDASAVRLLWYMSISECVSIYIFMCVCMGDSEQRHIRHTCNWVH